MALPYSAPLTHPPRDLPIVEACEDGLTVVRDAEDVDLFILRAECARGAFTDMAQLECRGC
jgi:hypothetical protein